jgi:hypothetical protein
VLLADDASYDEAWRRADALLEDSLTPQQYESYRGRGFLEVKSRSFPGRVYRVDGWRPVSVYEYGKFVGAVCIRPREHLPGPDVVLARKLMIEGAEPQFLRAGNWLQPAWRPAGTAPTVFLIALLVLPWLLHLKDLGPFGILVGSIAVVLPTAIAVMRARIRASRVAGLAGRPGTPRVDAGPD